MAEELPSTMQAAVYREINEVRTETIAVPEIGKGEVLVRIDTCGICGTDLKKIHTGSHAAPRVFGHEMAGTIAAVGEGVKGFGVGDRVMAFHHIPCGECFYCRKKTFAQCETYKLVGTTAGVGAAAGGGVRRPGDGIAGGRCGVGGRDIRQAWCRHRAGRVCRFRQRGRWAAAAVMRGGARWHLRSARLTQGARRAAR